MLACCVVENAGVAGMAGLRGGGEGWLRRGAEPMKNEKSFREMPNPLKSHKTAKSGLFGVQGYQGLSKTHDFADEMISFRFRFVLAIFRFARNFGEPGGA